MSKRKNKGGRPTKLTPELQAAFLDALRRTWYVETAADLAGIQRVTVYRWIKAGRRAKDARNPYKRFCNAVKKVLADNESGCADRIREASEENWTAAAWLLERRNPKRWGRKDKATVEHTGPRGGPVQVREVIVATRQEARSILGTNGDGAAVPGTNGVHRLNGTH